MKKPHWLVIPIAAIGYRLRGSAGEGGWVEKLSGWSPGTFLGRLLFWCLPMTILLTPTIWWSPVIFGMAYLGVMFGYFGGKFDLSLPENRTWNNYARLTLRGMFIPAPVCLLAGHWWMIAGGAMFVPCYLLGGLISTRLKMPLLHGNTEWGEFLLGLSIAMWSII